MVYTGIDAIKKQRNAEYAKQYRMKLKLLMQQQTSTSSEPQLAEKQNKAEYTKQYRLKRKLLIQQQASTSSEIELRHINDLVLSSLKMEGIRSFFLSENRTSAIYYAGKVQI
jgi:quinol monooxygenase YgiN